MSSGDPQTSSASDFVSASGPPATSSSTHRNFPGPHGPDFFCARLKGAWPGAAALLFALLSLANPAVARIYAYADEAGEVVLTDAPGRSGWRVLFTQDEPGARTVPAPIGSAGCSLPGRQPLAAAAGWQAELDAIAGLHELDPHLLFAVIWAESRCNPRAVSPKGARGLMQLMPATARSYGVTDAFDPWQNVRAGARYLRDLLGMFSGNLELALAAYNAGPKSVIDARMRIPAFSETRAYVPAVLERMRVLKRQ